MVARFAPTIFNGKGVALKTISDLLIAHRKTALQGEIALDDSIPESMREMLLDTARKQLKDSYQTTLICAKFTPEPDYIGVQVVSCGDSGFFAFSPKGELLMTSLVDEKEGVSNNTIPFTLDTELLTKVAGSLSEFPDLAKEQRISNPERWLVCKPICSCGKSDSKDVLLLDSEDLLLVPRYLAAIPLDPQYRDFRRFRYSRFIRRVESPQQPTKLRLDSQGNATAVLPDHFYSGGWETFDDKFPRETSFLLCSDGFYRAFEEPAEIWDWLKRNEERLASRQEKKELLKDIHQRLQQKTGDDDVSLIWLSPKS